MKISDLNKLYFESEEVDRPVWQEMRSNILLASGEHYAKRGSRYWSRIRDNKKLSQEDKLRLTKNHLSKITKSYVNNILTFAPGVTCVPYNENERSHQKAAELNNSVLADMKQKQKLSSKIRDWANDFINVGEVALKIFFDPNKGTFKGMQPYPDDMEKSPPRDEWGNPILERPVFSGDICFERIWGFNLLRAREAKTMDESRYLCYRKMVSIDDLKTMYADDPEKLALVKESNMDVYTVFEGASGSFYHTKNQTMLREWYFKPSLEFPSGYFYISTEAGVFEEGELPFGIYPIIWKGFDEIQTTPRGRSIIRLLRPYQAEINRCASQIATHQITLGDDKLLIQSGTKLAAGGQLPGVRAIQYTGVQPGILEGRSGAQYLDYMNQQISEMYAVANVSEEGEEKTQGQGIDPYALLFRSLKQKKKFVLYGEKFEEFLVEVFETALKLRKAYLNDDELIRIIGKNEYINIPEYRATADLLFRIKVEPRGDDLETQMGKQLTFAHILQYAGQNLAKEDIGMIARAMPFGNNSEAFKSLTQNWDNINNDMLALDRGQWRPPKLYEDHKYVINQLIHRMKEPDFEFLSPEIQNLYDKKLQMHEQLEVQQAQAIQQAEAGFIPSGGYLVVCDFYVTDPEDPGKTRRARIPYESLSWLIDKLQQQGSNLQALESMERGAVADMAKMMLMKTLQPQLPPGAPVSQPGPQAPIAGPPPQAGAL